MGKRYEEAFCLKGCAWDRSAQERYSASLGDRGAHTAVTASCLYRPARMADLKHTDNTRHGAGCREQTTQTLLVGMWTGTPLHKPGWWFLKHPNMQHHTTLRLWKFIPEKQKRIDTCLCTNVIAHLDITKMSSTGYWLGKKEWES